MMNPTAPDKNNRPDPVPSEPEENNPEASGAPDSNPFAEEGPPAPAQPGAEEDIPAGIYEQAGMQGDLQEALAKIKALEEELAQRKDLMLRAVADAENTKRRALKDRDEGARYAIAGFSRDMLAVSDNLRRALEAVPEDLLADTRLNNLVEGIRATEREMLKVFGKNGITRIDPMGEPFDPNFHEVMFEAPGTGQPPGTVIQVMEPGYILKDRLLRPARVGVAKDEGGSRSPPPGDAAPGGHFDTEA